MRFGLFFQVPDVPGHSHAERYTETFELIELAESLGFDVAWLAELHFGGAFSLLSNPLMAVPVIAQRTRRIRIGTAVTLLPLHHPLSLAEQAATADVLSGPVPLLIRLLGGRSVPARRIAALSTIAGSILRRTAWIAAGRSSASSSVQAIATKSRRTDGDV